MKRISFRVFALMFALAGVVFAQGPAKEAVKPAQDIPKTTVEKTAPTETKKDDVKKVETPKSADKKADDKKAAPKKEPPPRMDPTVANFKYGNESERQVFDFFQAKSDKPTPVMVFIHGGGWVNGDKNGYGTTAIKPYLDAGISVASVNYRFINQAMEQKVEPPVKACLYDAARAIQTIRSKAKEWNIDPTRIACSGGSAGACTSLWLAMHDDLADPKSSDPIGANRPASPAPPSKARRHRSTLRNCVNGCRTFRTAVTPLGFAAKTSRARASFNC
ncbi:MAG: alpha/beta hydrolase [Pirellulales bacterium]